MLEQDFNFTSFENEFEQFQRELLELKNRLLQPQVVNGKNVQSLDWLAFLLNNLGIETKQLGTKGLYADFLVAPGSGINLVRFAATENLNSPHSDLLSQTNLNYLTNLNQAFLFVGLLHFLNKMRHLLKKNIRVLFQPERYLSGYCAEELIRNDILANVHAMYGFHFNQLLTAGAVGFTTQAIFPDRHEFSIVIHGSSEDDGQHLNTINAAAKISTVVNQITSRKTDPLKPAAISLTSIQSHPATADSPPSVEITGNLETFEESVFKQIMQIIEKSVSGVANVYDMSFEMDYRKRNNLVNSKADILMQMLNSAEQCVGADKVTQLEYPSRLSYDLWKYFTHIDGVVLETDRLSTKALRDFFTFDATDALVLDISVTIKIFVWHFLHK